MKMRLLCLSVALVVVSSSLWADEVHQHNDSSAKLGTVSFPLSCSPQEQESVERGLVLLHSFLFDGAQRQFEEAAQKDPSCAMAYWAEAIGLYRPLAYRPSDSEMKQGWALVQKAQAPNAKTQREHDYIDAVAIFYRSDTRDYETRSRQA
jgi:hypothetical protein